MKDRHHSLELRENATYNRQCNLLEKRRKLAMNQLLHNTDMDASRLQHALYIQDQKKALWIKNQNALDAKSHYDGIVKWKSAMKRSNKS